jgi:hypothetical protein
MRECISRRCVDRAAFRLRHSQIGAVTELGLAHTIGSAVQRAYGAAIYSPHVLSEPEAAATALNCVVGTAPLPSAYGGRGM